MEATEVARYFLSLDADKKVFQKNLVCRKGRHFYDGNAKLNKFLHLAQNIYIAKHGVPLFDDCLYAYDNGAVVPEVQENYSYLWEKTGDYNSASIPDAVKLYLRKFFVAFQNADLDELISLSHEDVAWKDKSKFYAKDEQKMDSLGKIDVYKTQYADIIKVLNRIAV